MAEVPNAAAEGQPSATETPTATFHGWSELPDELKVEILSHALTFDKPISNGGNYPQLEGCYNHNLLSREHPHTLISTRNRRLAAVVQEVYYRENTFVVLIVNGWGVNLESHVWHPKPATARLIRYLEVRTQSSFIRKKREDMFLNSQECWRWLLRPSQLIEVSEFLYPDNCPLHKMSLQEIETYTAWQTSFSNTQDLTLDLLVSGTYQNYEYGRVKQEPKKGMLPGTRRAKQAGGVVQRVGTHV
jgi:hypothetical protein